MLLLKSQNRGSIAFLSPHDVGAGCYMPILDKTTLSPACRACVLGFFLLSPTFPASAEDFLSVIKRLLLTANNGPVPVSPSSAADGGAPELDWVSEKCVGCHNGVKATGIALKSPRSARDYPGHPSRGHPVGMKYEDYAHTLPFEYRPKQALRADVDLVDGKVSCISCHRSKVSVVQKLTATGQRAAQLSILQAT